MALLQRVEVLDQVEKVQSLTAAELLHTCPPARLVSNRLADHCIPSGILVLDDAVPVWSDSEVPAGRGADLDQYRASLQHQVELAAGHR